MISPIKVFMVDANPLICLKAAAFFAKENIEFKYCSAPENALAEINLYYPSVIIQDIGLPDKYGFELLKTYKQTENIKDIPVLMYSNEQELSLKREAFALNATDFLHKEGDLQELIAKTLFHSKRFYDSYQTASPSLILSKKSIKVLMIDHSKFSCLVMQKVLSQEDDIIFNYCLFTTDAMNIIESYLPNIILLQLYDISNEQFSLIHEIKKNRLAKNIPIIIYAPFENHELQTRTLNEGVAAFIVKAMDNSDHVELLDKIKFHATRQVTEFTPQNLNSFTIKNSADIPVRLLMIDDSKFICKTIKQLLSTEKNIHLSFCNDPTQALELAKSYNPTIVLMDLEMPQISGFELLAIFRKDEFTQEIPVIVLSGISDASIKAKAFALGANDYMEKEMDKVELISRIQYHSRSYLNSIQLNNSIQELMEMQKLLKSQSDFIRKTFGRYLSDEIVNSILESPEGLKLGGESRNMSIMMTDLRGFTALSERLPAETVLAIINNYLLMMTDILLKYNGTIDEFIGDAILAIFGAPIQREDDAERAIACAIEMQLAMEKVSAWNLAQGYPAVSMGIGINTGDAVVGNIGSEKRAKYGIVGRNVNLTSRIESYTVGGQIFVSESTVKKCGDILTIEGQMEVMPKGVKQAITIYEVSGIGGRFNLFLKKQKNPELMLLNTPLLIQLTLLKDKHASQLQYSAELLKLSTQGALVKSALEVEKLSNLKISLFNSELTEICDDLYAKVTQIETQGFVISFTAIPPEAEKFFMTTLQQEAMALDGFNV